MQQTHKQKDFHLEINFMRNQDKKVLYEIGITVNDQIKKSFRRYSQLRTIHHDIQKDFKLLKENVSRNFNIPLFQQIVLPPFPGSALFGITNNSEKKIMQRKQDLYYYFQELLTIPNVVCLPYIKELFPSNEIQHGYQTYQIKILKNNSNNDIILYHTEFKNTKIQEEIWTCKYILLNFELISLRYSSLRNLHQILKSEKNHELPDFPGREILGHTSESLDKIEKRQQELEEYLNKLFREPSVVKNVYVQYLLNCGKQEYKNNIELDKKNMVKGDLNKVVNLDG